MACVLLQAAVDRQHAKPLEGNLFVNGMYTPYQTWAHGVLIGNSRFFACQSFHRVAAGAIAKKLLHQLCGCDIIAYVSQVCILFESTHEQSFF